HHDPRQRLVHRQQEEAVASDARLVAQRALERIAENKTDVLHRVVIVDINVAIAPHVEVEQPVLREQRQHVVEERHARIHFCTTGAIDRECQLDLRLGGLALDGYFSVCSHASMFSSTANMSSSEPTLMRRNGAVKAWLGKVRTRMRRDTRKS